MAKATKPATKVSIKDTDASLPVHIEDTGNKAKLVKKSDKKVLAPTTTEQEDIVTEGQRAINLMWESTQSKIALLVVQVGMAMNGFVVVVLICLSFFGGKPIDVATVAIITGSIAAINLTSGIIIGFYFSRTNHSAIGGTGKKEQASSIGTR